MATDMIEAPLTFKKNITGPSPTNFQAPLDRCNYKDIKIRGAP